MSRPCKMEGYRCKNERAPSINDGEPMFWVPGGGVEVGGSTTEVPPIYALPIYKTKHHSP